MTVQLDIIFDANAMRKFKLVKLMCFPRCGMHWIHEHRLTVHIERLTLLLKQLNTSWRVVSVRVRPTAVLTAVFPFSHGLDGFHEWHSSTCHPFLRVFESEMCICWTARFFMTGGLLVFIGTCWICLICRNLELYCWAYWYFMHWCIFRINLI